MRIQNCIIKNIPAFKVEDSLEKVIQFFEHNPYSHVAILADGDFLGVLSENDLDNFEADKKVGDYRFNLETFFVRSESNWLDVLETFARNEANLMPVLDEANKVQGYYDLTNIVSVFIDTPFFTEPGGLLVVAKGAKDYSFSEIAQIVESNNTRIIGAFITDIRDEVVQLTIKISSSNLNEVIQSFRRYNYTILLGNNDDQFLESLKQRSDYLDKYLNV